MPELPIAVARTSGGVDSSTVAAMLVREGRTVVGMTMQLWNQRRLPELAPADGAPSSGRCCSLDDVYDARRVAEQIGIPYYVVNFEQQFEEHVVKPFVEEYLAGRTPIPCTLCNNYIKFDRFLEMADSVGAHTTWPPGTTPACASTPPPDAINSSAPSMIPKIRPTSSSA